MFLSFSKNVIHLLSISGQQISPSSPLYLSFPEKFEESRDLLGFTFLQGQQGAPPAPAARAGRTVGQGRQRRIIPGFAPTEGQS